MPSNRTLASALRSPALAVAAAFGLRMVLLWLSHYHENPTAPRFETVGLESSLVAASLAAGKGFFGPYPGYQATTAVLAPVYPFLGSIGYKLFHGDSFAATVWFQIINCIFSAATCWPIYAIGKKLFGGKIGLASGWFWVFLPYAVLLPLEWTWDQSLSALMLALIILATLVLSESTSPSSLGWTGYGLLWGFTALVNPTLCIVLPFLLVWLAIRRGQSGLPSLGFVATSVLMFILALVPWTIRNYYAVDGLVFVKTNFGLELWLGNNPAVNEIYSPDLHPGKDPRERFALIMEGEPNYNRQKQREAIAFIEAQPALFVKHTLVRIEDNWTASYDARIDPWILTLGLSRADIWFCSLFSIFSLVGMILALRANFWDSLPLALCILLIPIPYYITHTTLRYRHPIDPFMTIFTVYAIARILSAFRGRRLRRAHYPDTLPDIPVSSARSQP
jgi:4-amino-4-deoxy-L-arabinose transferase-like glycosyltransferase